MNYDLIGDIHGYADDLENLLYKLGYHQKNELWSHPENTAIFLGDYIDRGPKQVETVNIVRNMVDNGSALAVMGNHEFNAIAWYLPDPKNPIKNIRPHDIPKNLTQHLEFIRQLKGNKTLHKELIDWFLTLPLWLELPELRIVHACWHPFFMEKLKPFLSSNNQISIGMMETAVRKPSENEGLDSPEFSIYKAVDAILKGIECPLPGNLKFKDKDGTIRDRVRIKWWETAANDFKSTSILPDEMLKSLPDAPLANHMKFKDKYETPVFFGHYWLNGDPVLQSSKAACLDYSVAKGGKLVAYSWKGEKELDKLHFVM